jgi:hypothetical protein
MANSDPIADVRRIICTTRKQPLVQQQRTPRTLIGRIVIKVAPAGEPRHDPDMKGDPRPKASCLIPRFDGAILSLELKEPYGTGTSWVRQDHARRPSSNKAIASPLATLSRELGINPKKVAKWRKRATVEDLKIGPKAPRSTTLSETEEAMVVAFRRHTLLPLDDYLYPLQPSLSHLTQSALHRCLQRHGISRLADIDGDTEAAALQALPLGFFHMDIAEVQTAQGKLYLFVGIDRTSKFAVTQLVNKADRRTAWAFLEHLLKAVPYQIHTILTDNGI